MKEKTLIIHKWIKISKISNFFSKICDLRVVIQKQWFEIIKEAVQWQAWVKNKTSADLLYHLYIHSWSIYLSRKNVFYYIGILISIRSNHSKDKRTLKSFHIKFSFCKFNVKKSKAEINYLLFSFRLKMILIKNDQNFNTSKRNFQYLCALLQLFCYQKVKFELLIFVALSIKKLIVLFKYNMC